MDERASGSMASMRLATRRNSQLGSRRMRGTAPGGTPSMRAGRTPAAFSTVSPSSICRASSLRQRLSASSAASGTPASALSALLRLSSSLPHSTPVMSGSRPPRGPSARKRLAQTRPRRRRSAPCRWWRGGSVAASPSFSVCTTLNGTMPATTRAMPASRASRKSALPTPFWRLTTVTPEGACFAISSAMASVSRIFTVTRMISASANAAAESVASRTADDATNRSAPSRSETRKPRRAMA